MKNTEIHHCGECKYFQKKDGIDKEVLANNFLNVLIRKGKNISPEKRESIVNKITSADIRGGIRTCIENNSAIEGSFKACEDESKFTPRKNIKSLIQRLSSLI